MKLQVRTLSPWFRKIATDEAIFSCDIKADDADALLCFWSPSPELFVFPRRKAWYCCEPEPNFRKLEGGAWPGIRKRLAPSEFLWHQHPDPRYRVSHLTHYEELCVSHRSERLERAIAIISNCGGPPWKRHPDLIFRNQFATFSEVDLFGRANWNGYRVHWWSLPRPPGNYLGTLPGDWPDVGKRDIMARYKVAICIENMFEPMYFTEKFVEAVCAGCIPVYRAHPSVAESVLEGAQWVDPVAYGGDPKATILAALNMRSTEVRRKNEEWLACNVELHATSSQRIFTRIGDILSAS